MIDQNKPYEESTSLSSQTGLPVQPATSDLAQPGNTSSLIDPSAGNQNYPSVPPVTAETPPISSGIAPEPTVVLPGGGAGVPKWFYLIFGITIIAFFIVTTLILLSFTQRPATKTDVIPTVMPQITKTSKLPTPTLVTNLATDSATLKLNNLGNSDEVVSIEADLKNTDLGVLDEGLVTVDNQTDNSL